MGENLELCGRELNGRFAHGNRLAGGNLLAQRTREMRQSIFDAVGPDQVRAVIATMANQAADGDVAAARVFLEYTCGKPAQSIELSGPDGGPLGVDVHSVTAVIMMALADDPAARFKVAKALRGAVQVDGDGRAITVDVNGA